MAGVTNAAEVLMLDWITNTGSPTRPGSYLGVYTTNPDYETGAGGVEATGGSYVRKAITWDAATGGAPSYTANSNLIEWTCGTDIAADTYTGFGIFSADTAGTLIGGAALSASRTLVSAGDKLSFPIGNIDLTQD